VPGHQPPSIFTLTPVFHPVYDTHEATTMTPTPGSETPFPTSGDLPRSGDDASFGGGTSSLGGATRGSVSPSTLGGPASESALSGSRSSAQPELMQRVVQGAHQTIDQLAERAAPYVERASHKGEDLSVRADHLREVGDEWAESMRTTVRENPLAAVAVAVAVGMLVARITR
jgi:ElaB/YqjD/DUF883 family membrane-anchored ribosome-binding protein